MNRVVVWLLLPIGLLLPPERGHAQGEDCFIVSSGNTNAFNTGTPQELIFIGGGARFRCPNGTTIASDSVARYTGQRMIEFIGRVRYTDEENILTASYVRYIESERLAIAQGDVVLTDRATGSVIEAQLLNYYQASETREEALVRIPSGRPHAILVSVARADSTQRDTTVVDADRMDIMGRGRFQGWGSVELTRADVVGVGDEASYDRDAGTLRLIRDARLTSDDYVLSGDTVDGVTNEADEIEELTATGSGRLDGQDVTVVAPRVRLFFAEGVVSGLVAVGTAAGTAEMTAQPAGDPAASPEPDDGERFDPNSLAVVTSTDFQLTADSIDVIAPGQVLERVVAVGHARGDRLTGELGDANVPAIAARDWMRGDTVITIFAEVLDAEPDSTGRRQVEVERVIAVGVGERATSSYRVRDEENAEAESGINYMLARRIIVHMREGNVGSVEAAGEVEGMYLQPVSRVGRAAQPGTGGGSVNR